MSRTHFFFLEALRHTLYGMIGGIVAPRRLLAVDHTLRGVHSLENAVTFAFRDSEVLS